MSETRERAPLSEDTRRLLNQIVVVGVGLLLFVLFALIVLPGVRRELTEPKTPGERATTASSAGWLDAAEAPAQRAVEIPPLNPAEVLEPTPSLLERGKVLYNLNCASCHGYSGEGDGLAATSLNPKPRDFTRGEGWRNGPTKTGVYKTLQLGLPGTGMVAYDILSPKDRMALVHTVRSFGKYSPPGEDLAALEALTATLASKGGKIPARIPVSEAIRKLVAEERPADPLAFANPRLTPEASALLGRAIADPLLAARFLAGLEGWRSDLPLLARTASAGAPQNGFNPVVATLTVSEWQALQSVLVDSVAMPLQTGRGE